MIKVGIVGGTGYTGAELLRLLVGHPDAEVVAITSRSEAGLKVADLFGNLRGRLDLAFAMPRTETLTACDLVFFATPNGTAMTMVPELLASGVRVIDLAADFRLRDPSVWEAWYGMAHACPELLEVATYGLPELNREAIKVANLVANPGCYPTATLLALLPLLEADVIDVAPIIADCKSGVSGAGRGANAALLMGEVGESFKAYAVPGHRHLPELEQTLARIRGAPVAVTFVPHLLPMIRGIHATLYGHLIKEADLQALFEKRYADEPFVDVLPAGAHPETRHVRGSNRCQLAVHRPRDGDVAVILSVIDNLTKGAAGQAVHSMNLMFGLPETVGLELVALSP